MLASVNDSLHILCKYNNSLAFTHSFTNYAPNTISIKQQVSTRILSSAIAVNHSLPPSNSLYLFQEGRIAFWAGGGRLEDVRFGGRRYRCGGTRIVQDTYSCLCERNLTICRFMEKKLFSLYTV